MYRTPSPDQPFLIVAFQGKVFALARADGACAWRFDSRHAFGPMRLAVHDGRVIVAVRDLFCLEYLTGELLWEAALPKSLSSSTPLVDGDHVYLGDAGEVAAFDVRDGRMLWHQPFKGEGVDTVSLAVPGAAAQARVSS